MFQLPLALAVVLGVVAIFISAWKTGLILPLLVILLLFVLIIFFRSDWLISLISPLICPQAILAVNPKNTNNHEEKKVVALTIDDGPDYRNSTQQILGVLRNNKASATFFLIGDHVRNNPTVVQDIIRQGHEIGNHMAEDKPTILLSAQDFQCKLTETHDILKTQIREVQEDCSEFAQESDLYPEVTWFRPGSAFATSKMIQTAREEYSYHTALGFVWPYDTFEIWPFLSRWFSDWFISKNVRDGSIIILHDKGKNSSRGERTVKTLEWVLPKLKKRGYKIVTLSELLEGRTPIRTWLEFCNPLDKLRQRIINSLLQPVCIQQWGWIIGIWLIFVLVMLGFGLMTEFIDFQLTKEFSLLFFLEKISCIFFIPSATEEIAVRASLLPGQADDSDQQTDIKWSIISLIIYVFYHLPGGLAADLINNLMGRETAYFHTFSNPIFLVLAGLLGLCCTITYLKTRSIWSSIIFHWLVVVVWLLFLGGYGQLNPV